MTDKNKRSRLTLKLPKDRTFTLKNSNSLVKVTIKGSKSDNSVEEKKIGNLKEQEIESRKIAVTKSLAGEDESLFDKNYNHKINKLKDAINSKLDHEVESIKSESCYPDEPQDKKYDHSVTKHSENVVKKEEDLIQEDSRDVSHNDKIKQKINSSRDYNISNEVVKEILDEEKVVNVGKVEVDSKAKTYSNFSAKKIYDPVKILKKERNKKIKYSYTKNSQKKEFSDVKKEYEKISREVIIPETISISDLASRMAEKTSDVIKKTFTMGMNVTTNQAVDADTAEIIVSEFNHIPKRVLESDVENIITKDDEIEDTNKSERAPVVTIMGHVDHGKTSLLDSLRSTQVTKTEFGGITQHIGASRIKSKNGKYITFLDTPGHEAFTAMRSRGANITDIVVLVVAADDGVKPQTIEAINHAKVAKVPIIVAVNKIDKPYADPSKVKHELLKYDIVSEDLGGNVMFVELSAKERINLEKLEEMILLQAEIMDLKASLSCKASGVVIESRIDPSKGVATTLLVQKGVLKLSDLLIVGNSYGKIRKMIDGKGEEVKSALPSVSVEILGLNISPKSGDIFSVIDGEKSAREIISYRIKKEQEKNIPIKSLSSKDSLFSKENFKSVFLIVKCDTHGSVEAIQTSLVKLGNENLSVTIVHSGTGAITESDVNLATVSNAIIIGFNTKANASTKELAKNKSIEIKYYSIIYNIIDDVKSLINGLLDPVVNECIIGKAKIKNIFEVSKLGKIAGCVVIDGVLKRGKKARILRDNDSVFDGYIKTIKRFKDDVKEIKNGLECGIALDGCDDMKEGDVIECYELKTE